MSDISVARSARVPTDYNAALRFAGAHITWESMLAEYRPRARVAPLAGVVILAIIAALVSLGRSRGSFEGRQRRVE